MERTVLLLWVLATGALAGCPMPSSPDKCKDVTCPTAQMCSPETGLCVDRCRPDQTYDAATMTCVSTMPTDCTVHAALCNEAQYCDEVSKRCVDNPAAPNVLTLQLVDRDGRAGVNLLLTNPFDIARNPQTNMVEMGDVTRDRYNADGNVAAWQQTWAPFIRQSLALLDGLDRNCGNQLLANAMSPRYSVLSALLAGDALHVDTSKTTCNQYLGVELGALGLAINDCGGRKPDYDVVDITYSLLATGMPMGLTDGVSSSKPISPTFPFLPPPQ
ncbi:MAG: hypothetical protein RMK29_13740 [Myxococcales bacterium]|nr:hypothetical protein [Myxococcales bacterium]